MYLKSVTFCVLVIIASISGIESQNPLNPFSSIFEGMRRLLRRGIEVAKNLKRNVQYNGNNQNNGNANGFNDNSQQNVGEEHRMSGEEQQNGDSNESKLIESPPLLIHKNY